MQFQLEMSCDNAAFEDGGQAEISRILRKLADDLDHGGEIVEDEGKVRDLNGNTVGSWVISEQD